LTGVLGLPLTINAGGTVMSPVIPSFDLATQSLFVTSSQAGSLVLSRYADRGVDQLDRRNYSYDDCICAMFDRLVGQQIQSEPTNQGHEQRCRGSQLEWRILRCCWTMIEALILLLAIALLSAELYFFVR
jgi:hypothetical protein